TTATKTTKTTKTLELAAMDIDLSVLRSLENEKDISSETAIKAIEDALLMAYHKTEGANPASRVEVNRATGHVTVWAREASEDGVTGREYDDTPAGFGRIAATTARQVILQRLRDVEDEITFGEYAGHEGDIVAGVIQQGKDPRTVLVDLGKIAREAGHRTKIAVQSHQQGVNAKGACIGPVGARVRNVMAELHGEKIDIVDYSDEPADFVANALSPARVTRVEVIDRDAMEARVTVPDYQLSLAIGKEGQNARLAARLTGWRIDIRWDGAVGAPGPAPRASAAETANPEAASAAGAPADAS